MAKIPLYQRSSSNSVRYVMKHIFNIKATKRPIQLMNNLPNLEKYGALEREVTTTNVLYGTQLKKNYYIQS